MPVWFYRLSSPPYFYTRCKPWARWLGAVSGAAMIVGLFGALVLAPPDYQQGESYRIIYVHVPAAWMSLFAYVFMATTAAIGLIWRIKVAECLARSAAPLGASFTFLTLATGSLWGKPMWGTWWVWDARLTSELLLLFLYMGYMALNSAIDDPRRAARASGVLALVGVVNIPVIHYSVEWWSTLHQGPTITRLDAPAIHLSMLVPLLLMAFAFTTYFCAVLLLRTRYELLSRERHTEWAKRAVREASP
ncbi:heme ABC transporter permease [Aquisalimonas lutea]|uniref:heme ABC transporter permease n=1 Tax=Aquisalimonas lutea TaxID=1327750 RepID=UPI0025B46544|nr:heme ABC transporter permease [Aquisalimonas lutea]MDN3519083.1 heme ABC transporter permease [Aquisalimonas lutea]